MSNIESQRTAIADPAATDDLSRHTRQQMDQLAALRGKEGLQDVADVLWMLERQLWEEDLGRRLRLRSRKSNASPAASP